MKRIPKYVITYRKRAGHFFKTKIVKGAIGSVEVKSVWCNMYLSVLLSHYPWVLLFGLFVAQNTNLIQPLTPVGVALSGIRDTDANFRRAFTFTGDAAAPRTTLRPFTLLLFPYITIFHIVLAHAYTYMYMHICASIYSK